MIPSAMLPDVGVTKGAFNLWQEDLLLDYTIEVEDKQFKVHKVIMASVSDYFKAMLTGGMVESGEDRVRLEGQSSLAVASIIQFVYTGELGATKASPEELLACAVYLQIASAIAVCTDLLCDKGDEKNCLGILSIFKSYSLKDGIRTITKDIRCNREVILKYRKPKDLPYEDFLNFMDSSGKSEWELFQGVKEWIDVDNEKRKQYMNNLLTRVRFAFMSQEQLDAIKGMDVYSNSEGTWQDLVVKAEEYHSLPTHRKVLDESEQSRVRKEPSLVCLTKDKEARLTLHASNQNEWKEYETTEFIGPLGRIFEVNNFLIATGKWRVLDPRTMKWSPMASKPKHEYRSGIAIVHCNKHLYALGGFMFGRKDGRATIFSTDRIDRYAFETNEWVEIPTKLPRPSTRLGAGVLNGSIYVVAGRTIAELDCYSPSTDTWCSKAPMLKSEYYDCRDIKVLEMWNEEVLLVMRRGMNIQYYSPTANQWSIFNPLSYVDTDLVFNIKGRVCARGNCLYFFNFLQEVADCNGEYIGSGMDDQDIDGACAQWKFQGQKIIETRLDDFNSKSRSRLDHNLSKKQWVKCLHLPC